MTPEEAKREVQVKITWPGLIGLVVTPFVLFAFIALIPVLFAVMLACLVMIAPLVLFVLGWEAFDNWCLARMERKLRARNKQGKLS